MKIFKFFILCSIFISSVQFSQWVPQTNGTTSTMYGIASFSSLPIIISVGGGKIYKTTNEGTNWLNVAYPLPENSLSDVVISGVTTCWAFGNGLVLKSTNSGTNWSKLTAPNRFWNTAYFMNDNTGWICGSTDTVLKTTNGGGNWIIQENNLYANSYNYGIQFTSSLLGFMCGYDDITQKGYIIRTINGGTSWAEVLSAGATVHAMKMINSSTGFASTTGKIYKTTNGGSNWNEHAIPGAGALYGLDFPVNEQTGYAGGIGGKIFKTTNAGTNWYELTTGTTSHIRAIEFKFGSVTTGFAVGNSGTILKTTNGGGAFVGLSNTSTEVPERSGLSSNYPNPFNPVTNISFRVAQNGYIKIAVFNMLGEEVAELVQSELKPGSYMVRWDAADKPSGIYFCKMEGNGFTDTKKMMLVK
ncbi:MAG: T9SS type A sorting domain-containing protein [Ignavibacteria bacterium]|nr:T9SS type A sorting domain-containing protein [Ignavibacteria bacterium]